MRKISFVLFVFILIEISFGKMKLKGDYLGQIPPMGNEAKIFAPGIVSNGMNNRDLTMMPDGKEIYFCASFGSFNYNAILFVKQLSNGKWTEPEIAPFSRNMEYMDFEPCISPDGKHLYFLSTRADLKNGETENGDQDIWCVDRIGESWGEPYNLGEPVNSEDEEYYPSISNNGNIYFTRQEKGSPIGFIYRSKFINGKYQEVEKLPEQVNSGTSQFNAFIAPDESYIIVPVARRDDSIGGVDYYISFRNENDEWSDAVNMGQPMNSENGREWSASLSSDGKYLFFMSSRTDKKIKECDFKTFSEIFNSTNNGSSNIYWMQSDFIEKLRPKEF